MNPWLWIGAVVLTVYWLVRRSARRDPESSHDEAAFASRRAAVDTVADWLGLGAGFQRPGSHTREGDVDGIPIQIWTGDQTTTVRWRRTTHRTPAHAERWELWPSAGDETIDLPDLRGRVRLQNPAGLFDPDLAGLLGRRCRTRLADFVARDDGGWGLAHHGELTAFVDVPDDAERVVWMRALEGAAKALVELAGHIGPEPPDLGAALRESAAAETNPEVASFQRVAHALHFDAGLLELRPEDERWLRRALREVDEAGQARLIPWLGRVGSLASVAALRPFCDSVFDDRRLKTLATDAIAAIRARHPEAGEGQLALAPGGQAGALSLDD